MYSTLSVHFLPALTSPKELAAGAVVMIDVLRASTTITAALAAGATEILPFGEIQQARQKAAELSGQNSVYAKAIVAAAAELSGGRVETAVEVTPTEERAVRPLLGGERGGLPIEGFDLGNSPSEYSAEKVAGRTIVFTTTNGTQALLLCEAAKQVLIGSFVNFSAVAEELNGKLPIHLLCAGTRGRVTREDVLFAGALVEKLTGPLVEPDALNDEARIARNVWMEAMGDIRPPHRRANEKLAEVLHDTQGGHNLMGVGLANDIGDASQIDLYDFAPRFDPVHWRIVRPEV
jgi:2-phosphosulfolactate phosphatase